MSFYQEALNTTMQVGQQNLQQGCPGNPAGRAGWDAGGELERTADPPGSTNLPIMKSTLRKGKLYLYMIVG